MGSMVKKQIWVINLFTHYLKKQNYMATVYSKINVLITFTDRRSIVV